MENVMKKQSKRIRISLFSKGGVFASMLLFVCPVAAFAQGAEVCQGTGYTIADAVPASAGSEYRWLENGNVLANTNQAAYNVPNNKAAGVYTYVRQSKSADCPDWQPSNEFTLTVFACSFTAGTATGATATFTDARDGKQYKTVVMPDGRTWFAQNLNYTKDLTFNAYAREANGKMFTTMDNGTLAIGSYWCPGASGSTYSGDQNACNIYGALYTWETAMMVDGKYADESKTSRAWDESWVSPYYYTSGSIGTAPNADRNNARGGTTVKGGGRGICPMGWHIPTIREWAIMLDSVEGDGNMNLFSNSGVMLSDEWRGTDAGLKLKSAKTLASGAPDAGAGSWVKSACCDGQDTYGFDVLPSGHRDRGSTTFQSRGTFAAIWGSSASTPLTRSGFTVVAWLSSAQVVVWGGDRGFPVRCLRH
jgi:uncharacterized protein (TIGR02145 family)